MRSVVSPRIVKRRAVWRPVWRPSYRFGVTEEKPGLLPEWVPRPVARRLGRGRLLKRSMHDEIRTDDAWSWRRERRRRPIHPGYAVALALFILGPPAILAMTPALPLPAAVIIGVTLNLVGAYVGYRAISERVEIDRG